MLLGSQATKKPEGVDSQGSFPLLLASRGALSGTQPFLPRSTSPRSSCAGLDQKPCKRVPASELFHHEGGSASLTAGVGAPAPPSDPPALSLHAVTVPGLSQEPTWVLWRAEGSVPRKPGTAGLCGKTWNESQVSKAASQSRHAESQSSRTSFRLQVPSGLKLDHPAGHPNYS